MASQRSRFIVSVALALVVVLLSCTPDAKYRVLSFFLDGVPPPGESAQGRQPLPQRQAQPGRARTGAEPAPAPEKYYTHTAYAQSRCGSCHDRQTGTLFRTPEEGLCQTCHTDPPGEARYLHGPIAVNACLVCHHPHVAPFPGVTLLDQPDLCFQCHQPEDLSTGPHHETPAKPRCTSCHSPHGGEDRFFLKRTEP